MNCESPIAMFLLFLAQASVSATPVSPEVVPHDFTFWSNVAKALSLPLSILTAFGTVWLTTRRENKRQLLQEILFNLRAFSQSCELVYRDLERHLQGNIAPAQNFVESSSKILSDKKIGEILLEDVKVFLPDNCRLKLQEEYMRWSTKLTDSPFPVQDEAHCLDRTHGHFAALAEAHARLITLITKIRAACLQDEVKYWKRRRRKRRETDWSD